MYISYINIQCASASPVVSSQSHHTRSYGATNLLATLEGAHWEEGNLVVAVGDGCRPGHPLVAAVAATAAAGVETAVAAVGC